METLKLKNIIKTLLLTSLLLCITSKVGFSQVLQSSFDLRTAYPITAAFNIANRNISYHFFSWSTQSNTATLGTLSACTLVIQTSGDGVNNWTTQDTENCLNTGSTSYLNFTANWIRFRVTVFTVSAGTPYLTVNYSGYLTSPGTNAFNAQNINNVLYCNKYSGVSASVQWNACLTSLGSTGGVANSEGILGAQTWTTDAFSGITASIEAKCGAATYTMSATSTIPLTTHLVAEQGCLFNPNSGITLTNLAGMSGSSDSQHFGGSGLVYLASNNVSSVYNVPCVWFGVTYVAQSAVTPDSSTAVQNCFNAIVKTIGGTATFSSGTIIANNITIPININIHCANMYSTYFKSTSAVPQFTFASTQSPFGTDITDCSFWGNSVGTKGLVFPSTGGLLENTFTLQRVNFQNFTVDCIENNGALLFTIKDSFLTGCVIGYYQPGLHTNLNVITGTQIKGNTSWGVKATAGNLLVLQDDDIEANGTVADVTTGGVYAVGMNGDGVYNCLTVRGGYNESNYGLADFQIGQPSNGGHCNNIFKDLIISNGNAQYGIYATGNKTMYTVDNVESFSHIISDIYDDGTVLRCTIKDSNYNGTNNSCSRYPDSDAAIYPAFNGPNKFKTGVLVPTINYIASETGANNAIVGALTGVTLVAGLQVTIKLAHTLQIGANTFNFNAGGALGIKSHLNTANNIAAAYSTGSLVTLIYDGTQWEDTAQ